MALLTIPNMGETLRKIKPIPSGDYRARIEAVPELMDNNRKDGQNYVVVFTLFDPAEKELRKWYPIQGNGAGIIIQHLLEPTGIAFTLSDPPEEALSFEQSDLLGCEVILSVELDTDDSGKPRNSITAVNAVQD